MTENLGFRVPITAAPCGAVQLSHVIQREPEATEESPGWFHRGNDNIPLRSSAGDPRCARITVERATRPRPLLGVCP